MWKTIFLIILVSLFITACGGAAFPDEARQALDEAIQDDTYEIANTRQQSLPVPVISATGENLGNDASYLHLEAYWCVDLQLEVSVLAHITNVANGAICGIGGSCIPGTVTETVTSKALHVYQTTLDDTSDWYIMTASAVEGTNITCE